VDDGVRIDKWLWAARFFKTRALARVAVTGGKVHLRGRRVKPGKNVKIGDALTINKGDEQFDISIMLVSGRRVSAPLAREMYAEDPLSLERREAAAKQRLLDREARSERSGRPDKRDRRRIVKFTRGENQG